MKRLRSYTSSFKLDVVSYAEEHGNRAAERQYGVNERRVREWRGQKERLKEEGGKRKKLKGGGRKALLGEELEESLTVWIEHLRSQSPGHAFSYPSKGTRTLGRTHS
jgi:hypothetical protein